jgi:hypothetical protein
MQGFRFGLALAVALQQPARIRTSAPAPLTTVETLSIHNPWGVPSAAAASERS